MARFFIALSLGCISGNSKSKYLYTCVAYGPFVQFPPMSLVLTPIDIELPPVGPPTFPIEPSFPQGCTPESNYCYGNREDPTIIQYFLQGEEFEDYIFLKQSLGYKADFSGNASISALKPVKEAKFNAVTEEFETVVVAVQSKRVKQSDFNTEGEGSFELNINTGTFARNNITGGDWSDSIKFGNQVTVKGTTSELGNGDDAVTFKKKVMIKGKNTIDLGEGGADTVELKGGAPGKGKLVITNFDENDTLVLKKKTFTYEDLQETKIEGIKIEFAE